MRVERVHNCIPRPHRFVSSEEGRPGSRARRGRWCRPRCNICLPLHRYVWTLLFLFPDFGVVSAFISCVLLSARLTTSSSSTRLHAQGQKYLPPCLMQSETTASRLSECLSQESSTRGM